MRQLFSGVLLGPCGKFRPNAPCMIDGKYNKKYLKDYIEHTSVDQRWISMVLLSSKNGHEFINRDVVSYNPSLLVKYN